MKKLFGKRKPTSEHERGAGATPEGPQRSAAVPPLPLQQLPPGGAVDPYGRPLTPSYNSAGYVQQPPYAGGPGGSTGRSGAGTGRPSRSGSGVVRSTSGISRTQSGMSSGRRSARRPREFIDLSQPEEAAIEAALEESMVTINYDDLLRDIQQWIFDLNGATGDVNSALKEANDNVDAINGQLAQADPEDAQGWHRIMWLSEQYPLVVERLREVGGRVAPVNDAVKKLGELVDFIRNEQPPLADAESVRDAVIASLFDDLGKRGLDASHPFSEREADAAKSGRLRSLLSMKRTKSVDKPGTRGGDVRDLVRQLIDEARRIPEPPPLPLNYDDLLAGLDAWIDACRACNGDVDAAVQDVRQQHDDVEGQKAGAMEDVFDPAWHRLAWLGEQLPLAEGRLHEVLGRIGPTNAAAKELAALKERIANEKPSLADAEALRDTTLSNLFGALADRGLDTSGLPPSPAPQDLRTTVARAVEEARCLPDMPPVPTNYGGVLEGVREWIEALEGALQDVAATQQEVGGLRDANEASRARAKEDVFDPTWHRMAWLSEQLPQAEARVNHVGDQSAPAAATLADLHELQRQIDSGQPTLEQAQAGLAAAINALLGDLGARGLNTASLPNPPRGRDVRGMIDAALEEAKRIPPAPPVPVNYSSLVHNIHDWIEQLEATDRDISGTAQEVQQQRHLNEGQMAGVGEDVYDPTWHRMAWLRDQYPLAEQRVGGVSSQASPIHPALQGLRNLLHRIETEKPSMEEAAAGLDAVVGPLLSALANNKLNTAAMPAPPQGADVRAMVGAALEEAKRIPATPPLPVNYAPLLKKILEWVEQLNAAKAGVQDAQQETAQAMQDAEAQRRGVTPREREAFHRLNWLTEQLPLADGRLRDVAIQITPANSVLGALQDLLQRINADKPPLSEAEASLDSIVSGLVSGLGQRGLDSAAGLPPSPAPADVRAAVDAAVERARRIPDVPPLPAINYDELLRDIQQWISDCDGAQSDVQDAQQDTQQAAQDTAARLAQLATDIFNPDWHQLNWESQQLPLAGERVQGVAGLANPPTAAAAAKLRALLQQIQEEQPLLEDARAAYEAAVAELLSNLGRRGLDTSTLPAQPRSSDMRGVVRRAVEEARRIPPAPPVPTNYSSVKSAIADWIEQLQAAQADAAAAGQDMRQQRKANDAKKAGMKEDVYDPNWHRMAWLADQFPLAESRVRDVAGQLSPADAAIKGLQALLRRIEKEQPPLAEAQAALDAAVNSLLADLGGQGLAFGGMPTPPRGADVRAAVVAALDEAKRLPPPPPLPVNYSSLLKRIKEWADQLEGVGADVDAAQQGVRRKREANDAKKAGTKEDVYDPAWHRMAWLADQYPLAEGRLSKVGQQAAPTGAAAKALRALQKRIEKDKPSLEDAQASFDEAINGLLAGLGDQGLDLSGLPKPPQGADVRSAVQRALASAAALPEAPPLPVDYGSILKQLQQWLDDLLGAQGDLASVQQEVKAAREANDAEKAAATEDPFEEAYHRLAWLSKEYPMAEGRLRDVGSQLSPAADAIQALRDLQRRIATGKPSFKEARSALDSAIATLLTDLNKRGLRTNGLPTPVASGDVRALVRRAADRARRLGDMPAVPERPRSLAPPPAAPERVRNPAVFNPPNLSAPRVRRKSRGVKPAATDAIKRDPRVITLFNELTKGRGVIPTTVAWHEVAAAGGLLTPGRRTPTGSTPAGTPRTDALTPQPSRQLSARGGALPSPATPGVPGSTPRRPSSTAGASAAAGTPRSASSALAPSMSTVLSGNLGTAESMFMPALAPELTEEEAAAYLPTLAMRGQVVAAFRPLSLQEVSDFVADMREQGGDAPRSGHAAAAFPAGRWRLLCESAAAFDTLLDMCDTLTKWECEPQANPVWEAHRLASYLDAAQAAVERVQYPYTRLRTRMAKAGIPWDEALLTDLRWAAQRAGAVLMAHALDCHDAVIRVKGFNQASVLQLLGSTSVGAYRVHQFSGGFCQACEKLYSELHERTVHCAHMLDHGWLRSTKWAG